MKVSAVQNGDERQAVVEVYPQDERIIFHGRSEKFSVKAGYRIVVPVVLVSANPAGANEVQDMDGQKYAFICT